MNKWGSTGKEDGKLLGDFNTVVGSPNSSTGGGYGGPMSGGFGGTGDQTSYCNPSTPTTGGPPPEHMSYDNIAVSVNPGQTPVYSPPLPSSLTGELEKVSGPLTA